MSEYRRKQASSSTSPVAFRGPAPASPRKSSTRKQSSVFHSFSTLSGFDSKLDELFGHAHISLPEGTAEAELERYVNSLASPRDTDILHFWEVSGVPYTIRDEHSQTICLQINRSEFPTLFAIAMDYLPIQASAVPCERVFSSAKETDTSKHNRIHPMLMEALQMLKFSLKKDRQSISFTDGWKTAKSEMMEAKKFTKEDLLAQLLTGDRQTTTDTLINALDDEQVEFDGDN